MSVVIFRGPKDHKISINMDKVLMVEPYSSRDRSKLIFSKDHTVVVDHPFEEVLKYWCPHLADADVCTFAGNSISIDWYNGVAELSYGKIAKYYFGYGLRCDACKNRYRGTDPNICPECKKSLTDK